MTGGGGGGGGGGQLILVDSDRESLNPRIQ